ncbi:hypothetical protein HPT25_24505 [Bacillus sp. BRMEA1]|uniref:hypothetical protein n=1 Tax=Neobacillus endophyticus TaxID=2738405 RepID=UPI0015678C01|nr:hypothetical protein [Neobacillus endophyticus]NRD80488.1 hypothetical protein [Neobacillus endophyticus]
MRFLFKRPKIDLIEEELDAVMEVMTSDIFIYLDLFVCSLILTLFLTPILNSLPLSCLLFIGTFGFFSGIYMAAFSRLNKKD